MARRSSQVVYYTGPSALQMAEANLIQDAILLALGVTAVGVIAYLLYQKATDNLDPSDALNKWIAKTLGWAWQPATPISVPPTGPAPNLDPNALDPTIHSDAPPWWSPTDVPLTPGQLGV